MRKTQGRRSKFLAGKTDTFVAIQPSNDFQNTLNVCHSEYLSFQTTPNNMTSHNLRLIQLVARGGQI